MKSTYSPRIFFLYMFMSLVSVTLSNAQTSPNPSISTLTSSISNLSYYYQSGPSASHSITITCSNLEGILEIDPPEGFEISTDNLTFQNISVLAPETTSEIVVYTRLRENQDIDTYSGYLTISSVNATSISIPLNGEVWVKDQWDFFENFNNSSLTGSYNNDSFLGNQGITWNYTSCRNERGYGSNYYLLTEGIKLNKEASTGLIYANNIPDGIKDFECKLYKGSTSSTNVEVSLWINDSQVAISEKFNDDQIHTFHVADINVTGTFKMEIRNNKSVTIVLDDISWTSYNSPDSAFIESSHHTTTPILGTTDDSFFEDAVITINANNLISDLNIVAPTRFLISKDNSTFGNSLTLNMGSGQIINKNIYIRLDPIQADRKYSGHLVLSSVGVSDVSVTCIGATRPQNYTPLIINEVDADTKDVTGTSGTDEYDFIELYSGQPGVVDLDGYVLVIFNGSNNLVDKKYSLDGYTTNQNGYFVIGNTATINAMKNYQTDNNINQVPTSMLENNDIIQNGPDAVALFYGVGGDFAQDNTLSTINLVDALVYTLSADDDHYPTGLMPLLNPMQPYVNENAYQDTTYDKQTNSMGRVLNGEGGLRNTNTYVPCFPTPGTENISILGENGLPTQNNRFNQKNHIYGNNSSICILSNESGLVKIYNLNGSMVNSLTVNKEERTTIPIKKGIYIVTYATKISFTTQKVSTY